MSSTRLILERLSKELQKELSEISSEAGLNLNFDPTIKTSPFTIPQAILVALLPFQKYLSVAKRRRVEELSHIIDEMQLRSISI